MSSTVVTSLCKSEQNKVSAFVELIDLVREDRQ